MSNQSSEGRAGFSRGEIENMCLLSAVPEDGCAVSELPSRLGLSPLLMEPVAEGLVPLINAGWLLESDDRVSVTPSGRAWLKDRISGIA